MNSWVWGKERMYLATWECLPVNGRNSAMKCGLGRKRTSKTRSAASGTPLLKPKLRAETSSGWRRSPPVLKSSNQMGAEFVDVDFRSIDLEVGDVVDLLQTAALAGDGAGDRLGGAQWMGTARLTEAPHQNLVAGVQVDQGHIHPLLQVSDDGGKLHQAAARGCPPRWRRSCCRGCLR